MSGLKVIDRTYLKLKEMVINYEILPGEQIHIEAVANQLNVSVTPVRETLNRLLHEGLIVKTGGRGFQNRPIDREELTDLIRLRGSLAISSLHFLMTGDLRDKVYEILDESQRNARPGENLPVCRCVLYAVGNRECLRIYENLRDKLHYVWQVYAAFAEGARQIREYSDNLERHVRARDLPAALAVIDNNITQQTQALAYVIPTAIARLYSDTGKKAMSSGSMLRDVYNFGLGQPSLS